MATGATGSVERRTEALLGSEHFHERFAALKELLDFEDGEAGQRIAWL